MIKKQMELLQKKILLPNTILIIFLFIYFYIFNTACAAASRAIGTLNGEQET